MSDRFPPPAGLTPSTLAPTDSTGTRARDPQWQAQIDGLSAHLQQAQRIVVFTGAGISTESGIPDFRGPAGVWKTMTPIDFGDFVRSETVRRESWRRKFSGPDLMATATPNTGHIGVAKLAQLGKLHCVITQNVDGLHQRAGVDDDQVIEVHGNANYATCLDCHQRYELAPIKQAFTQNDQLPYCEDCGGMIKTATISFGQAMPELEMQRAHQAVLNCDLLLAMGSSMSVYPAASLPRVASQQGARLILINNEATDLDDLCDLVIHRPIGESLSAALAQMPQSSTPNDSA